MTTISTCQAIAQPFARLAISKQLLVFMHMAYWLPITMHHGIWAQGLLNLVNMSHIACKIAFG